MIVLNLASSLVGLLLLVLQPALPSTAEPLTDLEEELEASARISRAEIVYGIMEAETLRLGVDAIASEYEVFVPRPSEVCVRYETRNGLYRGAQNFRAVSTGWVRIPFHSRLGRQVLGYGEDTFAIRATLSEDCDNPSKGDPLTRARRVGGGTTFVAVIHADGNPASVLVVDPDHPEGQWRGDCERFEHLQNVRFDRKCLLPPMAFETSVKTAIITRPPGNMHPFRVRLAQPSLEAVQDDAE